VSSIEPASTETVPPDRRVYVFEDHQADEGGPRSFSPRLVAEALAAAQAGNYRFVSPLPRLIEQALGGGAPIEMIADDPSHFRRGVPLTDYCKVSGERLMVFSRRAADALRCSRRTGSSSRWRAIRRRWSAISSRRTSTC